LLCPSNYLKAADLRGRDVNVVIDHLEREQLVMVGGRRELKVVAHIRSAAGKLLEKRWVLNKTNLRAIAATIGERDVGKWGGGKITIYPTTCRGADGKQVECIRVRVKVSAGANEMPEEMTAPVPRVEFLDELEEEGAQP
jgi:hypothetical protein